MVRILWTGCCWFPCNYYRTVLGVQIDVLTYKWTGVPAPWYSCSGEVKEFVISWKSLANMARSKECGRMPSTGKGKNNQRITNAANSLERIVPVFRHKFEMPPISKDPMVACQNRPWQKNWSPAPYFRGWGRLKSSVLIMVANDIIPKPVMVETVKQKINYGCVKAGQVRHPGQNKIITKSAEVYMRFLPKREKQAPQMAPIPVTLLR